MYKKIADNISLCDLEQHFIPEPNSGCWIWLAALDVGGYGRYYAGAGVEYKAHRAMYVAVKGPIPADMPLDHLCRNRCCVNPDHLEIVTQKINIRRGDMGKWKTEQAKLSTHCASGHEFTADNVWVQKGGAQPGRRRCKLCTFLRNKKWQTDNKPRYLEYLRKWREKNQ